MYELPGCFSQTVVKQVPSGEIALLLYQENRGFPSWKSPSLLIYTCAGSHYVAITTLPAAGSSTSAGAAGTASEKASNAEAASIGGNRAHLYRPYTWDE